MSAKNKVSKPLSLSPANIIWITKQAASKTDKLGKYVSASKIVDELITAARESETPTKQKAGVS